MPGEVVPPESMPVGLLAARVQADPALAMELPAGAEVAEPARWERRLRFVLEAAVCGELDDRGLVESITPIPESYRIVSFRHLGVQLDDFWRPAVDKKLAGLHGDKDWKPVFKRTELLIEGNTTDDGPYDYYSRLLHESSPGLVTRFLGALYTAAEAKRTEEPAVSLPDILKQGIDLMRRAGVRGHTAFVTMVRDFESGDRHQILELQPGRHRLAFTQAIALCPVGTDGKTVGDLEDEARREGREPIGCPALKYGQIPVKLALRIIDDSERFGLFERLEPARSGGRLESGADPFD